MKETLERRIERIKGLCFDPEIEKKLIAANQNTTEAELIASIQEYDCTISNCSECGNPLEEGEDGYFTGHGTCNDCVDKGEDLD